jgi:hypothetical protein
MHEAAVYSVSDISTWRIRPSVRLFRPSTEAHPSRKVRIALPSQRKGWNISRGSMQTVFSQSRVEFQRFVPQLRVISDEPQASRPRQLCSDLVEV